MKKAKSCIRNAVAASLEVGMSLGTGYLVSVEPLSKVLYRASAHNTSLQARRP